MTGIDFGVLNGPKRHRFTNDIIVLGVKPTNKYNTSCVYKACDEILGCEETLKNLITNKKNIVRNHLKNCKHFHAKKGSEEAVSAYCNKTDDKEKQASQTLRKHQNADTSAIDISSERERVIDIIPKIEKIINDTLNIGAKLLAIVSNSALVYAAA
ncbi:13920_t:CDS:2, partial [Racocetra fulgida]